jgi:hypothetical protein
MAGGHFARVARRGSRVVKIAWPGSGCAGRCGVSAAIAGAPGRGMEAFFFRTRLGAVDFFREAKGLVFFRLATIRYPRVTFMRG